MQVEAVEVTAHTGAQIADRLRSLGARDATTDVSHLAGEFEAAMSRRPEFATMLDWVRHAAVGFPKDRAVDYPRETKNGPAYTWFVENDK